jgi:hypothetical protein
MPQWGSPTHLADPPKRTNQAWRGTTTACRTLEIKHSIFSDERRCALRWFVVWGRVLPICHRVCAQAAKDLNVGSLVTEFDISDDVQSMTESMDIMDSMLLSWIGWEYKGFGQLADFLGAACVAMLCLSL